MRRIGRKERRTRVSAWRARLALFLAVMVTVGAAWSGSTPAYAATQVTVPLPTGPSTYGTFAAYGPNLVLAQHRSTDGGATWTPDPSIPAFPDYVGAGKIVDLAYPDDQLVANVYDVATGTTQAFQLPTGWYPSATATQALRYTDDGQFVVHTYATGESTPVLRPDSTDLEPAWASITGEGRVAWVARTTTSPSEVRLAVAASATSAPGAWASLGSDVKTWLIAGERLLYYTTSGTGASLCSRPLASPATESCAHALSGDQTDAWLSLYNFGATTLVDGVDGAGNWVTFRWSDAIVTPIVAPPGLSIQPFARNDSRTYGDTAYVILRDALEDPTVRKVNVDGSLAAGFTTPLTPAIPGLAVAPDRVVGTDERTGGMGTGWTRSVSGGGFGAESLFPQRASSVAVSAGRTAAAGVDGWTVFDRGMSKTATIPGVRQLDSLSGPYLTYASQDATGQTVHPIVDVTGKAITSSPQRGALFGTRYVTATFDADPAGRAHVTITDITGKSPAVTRDLPPGSARYEAWLAVWNDAIAFTGCDTNGCGVDVYHLGTGALIRSVPGGLVDLGDGYVIVRTWPTVTLIDLASGSATPLDHADNVASDGVGHVAYATETDLVWRDFSSLSTSAPRVLGILAPATFDATSPSPVMKIDIDTTKQLAAGSLQVKNSTGATVRTISTPASSDGSLRLQWDGKNASGDVVPSGTYSYTLVANAADGTGAAKAIDGTSAVTGSVQVTGVAAALPGGFVPVEPVRIVDTRFGVGGFTGPVGANQSLSVAVAGNGGVPTTGASAVVLNVTVVSPQQAGNITAYPSDATSVPVVSNLNFVAGQVVPNLVTVKLGADGKIKLANQSKGATYLIADVAGYYVAGTATEPGAFVPVSPVRLLDTRDGTGTGGVAAAVAPGASQKLKVTGVGGVPASNVAAVVLNVTEVAPTKAGNITVYPSDTPVPVASNLNFLAGDVRPNLVTVKVSADGFVSLANQSTGATHLLADVAGYYLAGTPTKPGMFVAVTPTRLLDTRFGPGPVGPVAPQGSLTLAIAGNAPVPAAGVGAVVLNVTEVGPQQAGNITVYPSDAPTVPVVSNLNFLKGDAYPNLVIVKVSADDGRVKLANQSSGTTYLLADVGGYFLK